MSPIWPAVTIDRQRLEDPLPDAGMAPAAEALMHRLPLAIAFRQIAPMRTGMQNPQATVDEHTAVRARASRVAGFAGQQRRNLRPLPVAQFITLCRYPALRMQYATQ